MKALVLAVGQRSGVSNTPLISLGLANTNEFANSSYIRIEGSETRVHEAALTTMITSITEQFGLSEANFIDPQDRPDYALLIARIKADEAAAKRWADEQNAALAELHDDMWQLHQEQCLAEAEAYADAIIDNQLADYAKHCAYLNELTAEHQDELDKALALCDTPEERQHKACRLHHIYAQRRDIYCQDNNFHQLNAADLDEDLPF